MCQLSSPDFTDPCLTPITTTQSPRLLKQVQRFPTDWVCVWPRINAPGVAVPTSHRWPLGDEGNQAKSQGGRSGPPPYPSIPGGASLSFRRGAFVLFRRPTSPARSSGSARSQKEGAGFPLEPAACSPWDLDEPLLENKPPRTKSGRRRMSLALKRRHFDMVLAKSSQFDGRGRAF